MRLQFSILLHHQAKNTEKGLTERHLNLISNSLNAHQSERNSSDSWNHAPSEILDKSEREGEEVEGNTLFEVDAVRTRDGGICDAFHGSDHIYHALDTIRQWLVFNSNK